MMKNGDTMSETYPLKGRRSAAFLRKYANLYRRILLLQEGIVGYQCAGRSPSLSPRYESGKLYAPPTITEVTFDAAAARRYEETIGAVLALPFSKRPAEVPRPDFAVELKVDFGYGVVEMRRYDFALAGDAQYREKFCADVCAYGEKVFRIFFQPIPRRGE